MRKLNRIDYDEVECTVVGLEGPCHVCRLAGNGDGYCQIRENGRARGKALVHRWVYQREVGEIPEGLVLDHRCRNRKCCNSKHLRPVTRKQNALENSLCFAAVNAKKTHCKYGHEYTEENTRRSKDGRDCRICLRAEKKRARDKARIAKALHKSDY